MTNVGHHLTGFSASSLTYSLGNGSDVFGSDICTCKPYLVFAIEECIRTAQRGGVGVVVYFRKEGRALGEVTKYLVYNLRKRGGDSADKYFRATELIAGVKDMRFQALMPDVLHWLGIKKVDNMVSMSDMCAAYVFSAFSRRYANTRALRAGNMTRLYSRVFQFSSATTFPVRRLAHC
jgi:GTP cyclohydrolase II